MVIWHVTFIDARFEPCPANEIIIEDTSIASTVLDLLNWLGTAGIPPENIISIEAVS